MATKPTVSTEWATQDVANGVNSTNNKVESTASHKAYGITFPEPPGRNHLNYWMNAADQWFTYYDEQDTGSGTLNTNYNINAATSDYSTRTIVIGAGVVLTDKTDDDQNFIQSTETTLVINDGITAYICVSTSNGVIGGFQSNLLLDTNEQVALYRVTTSGGIITQVVDLRSVAKGSVVNSGYTQYDPQTVGSIQGNYSNPLLHNDSDPGFFLGRYSGTGTSALQGFAVTNSSTDYVEYNQGDFEIGSGVTTTINGNVILNSSATSNLVSDSSYDSGGLSALTAQIYIKNTAADGTADLGFRASSGGGANYGMLAFEGLNQTFRFRKSNTSAEAEVWGEFHTNNAITESTQLTDRDYVDARLPTGSIIEWGLSTPPAGYLELDGSAISRSTYADLFAVVSTTWGVGNGTTTFNIRDDRGEFKRGWDNSRGVDSGRGINSTQSWAIENITGSLAGISETFSNPDAGIAVGTSAIYRSSTGPSTSGTPDGVDSSSSGTMAFDASRNVQTSTETRPRNIATMYCVKY